MQNVETANRYTTCVNDSEPELAYYRAIEDLFATLRGVPHVLSPKDFQLMRGWWRDRVPLSAVTAGITEVFARRRDRDEPDPVVSLTYCRHAVQRAAKTFSQMHVGEGEPLTEPGPDPTVAEALQRLASGLRRTASNIRESMPRASTVVSGVADQLARVPEMPAGLLEEHLYGLESAMLASCWQSLPEEERRVIEVAAAAAAEAVDSDDGARERTRRAVRDRELRLLLDLPRLELR